MRVGVVGGTGFYAVPGEAMRVETAWGDVEVRRATTAGREVFFVARHGPRHERPAHRVEHRANVAALSACRVERVLGVSTVGSLRKDIPPGSLVVPDDFVDLSRGGVTFFDDRAVHVDMSEPFCPELRRTLSASGRGRAPVHDGGTYVCMPGPRLETPAEVR
ncbi:MAG: MTAP family purine nucleoside phosphorylase, partial [Methanobacteriota archaeon]